MANEKVEKIVDFVVDALRVITLAVIGATIVWAAVDAYLEMMRAGGITLADILLLFIYLQMGAMVAIYFKTGRLPVLFLLYIGMTAMTRFLVTDLRTSPDDKVLWITGAILLIAVSVFVLQFAMARYAADEAPRKGTR